MRSIILIAHNLRSTHNVGSLLRTAEGLGVTKVYLTGYTPYPLSPDDPRLPHVAIKIDKQINKTALGAMKTLSWEHQDDVFGVIRQLVSDGYSITPVEQTLNSINLPDFVPNDHVALLVGREVEGVEQAVLDVCDVAVQIPMFGSKESFNVVQAAAMALYHCRFK